MKNEKYQLFSNGTEFMSWQTENCEKCVKAVWYNEKTGEYPSYRCQLQKHIELASATDGMGNKRDYTATHSRICPRRQTERPKRKPRESENQMNLFE